MLSKDRPIIRKIIVCLIIVLVALHLYSTYFLSAYHGVSAGDIVLVLTAAVVFWYALETSKLKQVMIEQKDISIMPVLVAHWDRKNSGNRLEVKNIGNFPAYRVRIREIKTKKKMDDTDATVGFAEIDVLLPSDNGTPIDLLGGNHLTLGRVTECGLFNHTTVIEYENIFGIKYEAQVIFRRDGLIRIMGAKRNDAKESERKKI